jgi:hypothetical protein
LEKSKEIIRRIQTRKLYKFVDEYLVDPKDSKNSKHKYAKEVEVKINIMISY